MILMNAIGLLVGAPGKLAWRPRGKVVALTDRNRLVEPMTRFKRPFHPTLSDVMADDWEVGDFEQLSKAFGVQDGAERPQ